MLWVGVVEGLGLSIVDVTTRENKKIQITIRICRLQELGILEKSFVK